VRAYPECSRSEEMVHTADQPDTAEPRTAPDPVPAAPRPQTSPGASAGQGQQPAPAAAPVSSTAAPGRVLRVSKPSRAPRIRSAPRRTRVVVRKVGPL
jgi:hypothetical protein